MKRNLTKKQISIDKFVQISDNNARARDTILCKKKTQNQAEGREKAGKKTEGCGKKNLAHERHVSHTDDVDGGSDKETMDLRCDQWTLFAILSPPLSLSMVVRLPIGHS
jgi:hypothetical protein